MCAGVCEANIADHFRLHEHFAGCRISDYALAAPGMSWNTAFVRNCVASRNGVSDGPVEVSQAGPLSASCAIRLMRVRCLSRPANKHSIAAHCTAATCSSLCPLGSKVPFTSVSTSHPSPARAAMPFDPDRLKSCHRGMHFTPKTASNTSILGGLQYWNAYTCADSLQARCTTTAFSCLWNCVSREQHMHPWWI